MNKHAAKYFHYILLACLLALGVSSYSYASAVAGPEPSQAAQKPKQRSSAAVKKEKQQTSREMEKARKKIEVNKKAINNKLNDLNRITADISGKKIKIDSLQTSIAAIDNQIKILSDSIYRLQQNVLKLRESSAQSLREARRRRQAMSALSFVASAADFSQAMLRISYLKQLDRCRANKTASLQTTLATLKERKERLAQLRDMHALNVAALNTEQKQLQKSEGQMKSVVADLRKDTKALEKEVKERQKKLNALDKELDRAIAEEQRIAAEQERKRQEAERLRQEAERQKRGQETPKEDNPKGPDDNKAVSTPPPAGEKADAAAFAKMKGKLMAPVAGSYSIVTQFGRTQHAELARVEIDNPGIDIETQAGSSARAVHAGVVSSIFFIDGYHNIVMVRHGEYLTIYANITKLAVRKGDKVAAGQNIGTIYSDPDDSNRTILHFEVRKERAKLNPLDWLKH